MAVDLSGGIATVLTALLWLRSRDQVEFHNTFVEPSGHQWHDQSALQGDAQPVHVTKLHKPCQIQVTAADRWHCQMGGCCGYAFAAVYHCMQTGNTAAWVSIM